MQRAAFPQHSGDPTPNLGREMIRDIPFSGGPWILRSWSQSRAVLTRNERYYGKKPLLDRVTFVPSSSFTDWLEPVIAGSVDLIQVYPGDPELLSQADLSSYPNVPDLRAVGGEGFHFEALWFNHKAPPLDDPDVREALMYAIDRQAVVDAIVKVANPSAEVLGCGFVAFPSMGQWCQNRPFERFTYDPAKSKSILEAAGYDCSSTPCVRNGKRLTIVYPVAAGPSRRYTTYQVLKDKALEAGFELRAKNYEGGVMLGDLGPKGAFGMLDFSSSGSAPDPSVTSLLACENVPTEANGFSGQNWIRWCSREATDLMHRADRELDPQKRLQLMNRIYELEASDFISLPLYVVPQVTVWRAKQVGGPIGAFSSSPNGPFWNMNEWHRPRRAPSP